MIKNSQWWNKPTMLSETSSSSLLTNAPPFLSSKLEHATCANLKENLCTSAIGLTKQLPAKRNSALTASLSSTRIIFLILCKKVILGDVPTSRKFAGAKIAALAGNSHTVSFKSIRTTPFTLTLEVVWRGKGRRRSNRASKRAWDACWSRNSKSWLISTGSS